MAAYPSERGSPGQTARNALVRPLLLAAGVLIAILLIIWKLTSDEPFLFAISEVVTVSVATWIGIEVQSRADANRSQARLATLAGSIGGRLRQLAGAMRGQAANVSRFAPDGPESEARYRDIVNGLERHAMDLDTFLFVELEAMVGQRIEIPSRVEDGLRTIAQRSSEAGEWVTCPHCKHERDANVPIFPEKSVRVFCPNCEKHFVAVRRRGLVDETRESDE